MKSATANSRSTAEDQKFDRDVVPHTPTRRHQEARGPSWLWNYVLSRSRPDQMNFRDKVRWHMKHDQGDTVPLLQDKYRVKNIVQKSGVPVAELLYVTEDPDTIPFDMLPPDFFLKANHGCGWNILQQKGKLYRFGDGRYLLDERGELLPEQEISSYRISRADCIRQCKRWLKTKYSGKEPSYHRIAPCILIEETLKPSPSAVQLCDYRLYTFHGRVQAVSIGSPSYRRRGENVFYTPDWTEIPLSVYTERRPDPLPPRPARLEEMISYAERLGANLNFVRVDLYDTSKGVVFGEFTFYPQAGGRNTPTACPVFNQWLGNFWEVGAR